MATWVDLKNVILNGKSEKQNEIYKPEVVIYIQNTCTQTIIHFYKSISTPKDKHWLIALGILIGEWDKGLVIKGDRQIKQERGFVWIDIDSMLWMEKKD